MADVALSHVHQLTGGILLGEASDFLELGLLPTPNLADLILELIDLCLTLAEFLTPAVELIELAIKTRFALKQAILRLLHCAAALILDPQCLILGLEDNVARLLLGLSQLFVDCPLTIGSLLAIVGILATKTKRHANCREEYFYHGIPFSGYVLFLLHQTYVSPHRYYQTLKLSTD